MTPENIAQTFGVSPLPLRDVISLCIGSGLFSADGEAYFTWRGCDYCSPNVGNTVTDCDGFPSLADARQGNLYQFRISGNCLNTLYYGEVKQ